MKCIWCNREIAAGEQGLPVEFNYGRAYACSDEHVQEYYRIARIVDRIKYRYIALMLLVCALGTALVFIRMKADNGALGVLVCFSGMGAVIWRYPYTTPQTVENLGGRAAIKLARRMALGLMIAGPIAALLMLML
jgi:hypothetical protein